MKLALVTELVEWVEPFFATFGYTIVSVAMFLESAALIGVVVPVYSIPTICVWATAVTLLGLFVGNHVETIDRILSSIGWVGLAVVAVVVGLWFWRHRSRPRSG